MSAAQVLEIMMILADYATIVDGGDLSRLGDVYAEDAVFEFRGGRITGLTEIAGFTGRRMTPRRSGVHVLSLPRVTVHGDEATSICDVVFVNADTSDGHAQVATAGTYHDRWVRSPDGWRVTHRQIRMHLGS